MPSTARLLFFGSLLVLLGGCEGDGAASSPDGGPPSDVHPEEVAAPVDILFDSSGPDVAPPDDVFAATDAVLDAERDASLPVTRRYAYHAIAGVSMGASAAMIAVRHPELFDFVGPLGGYVDITYLHHLMTSHVLAGFCPAEQILAHLDDVNRADVPGVFCGPTPTEHPYEHAIDFNNWYFTTNGGTFDRDFYFDAFTDFTCVFGNFTGHNAEGTFLPPGMTREWLRAPSCESPLVVGYPTNLNREYNPEGRYPLITFCDGQTPVGCTDEEPPRCGKDNPDYWSLAASYDPTQPHRRPVPIFMAVDYNENGVRDYGEPIVMNAWERFEDVGTDGCPSPREAGDGSCLEGTAEASGADPNGDDYDPEVNPLGTEGDWRHQDGEPFDDDGVDGVDAPEELARDYGEDNGVWDVLPQRRAAEARDPRTVIETMPEATLEALDWWVDGGRRDMLNSAVSSLHMTGALVGRGQEVRQYTGYAGHEGTLFPEASAGEFLQKILAADLSPEAVGKNVFVTYGNPDATVREIHDGNGGHVGDALEVVSRFLAFFVWTTKRWPDMKAEPGGTLTLDLTQLRSAHTAALDSRMPFVLSLPPGYFDPERAEERYPVVFFLHGHGQDPADALRPVAVILQQFMATGGMARVIIVMPSGWCCLRDKETGLRECACQRSDLPGHRACVDPTCTGPDEECDVRDIPDERLERECDQGSFFMNLQSDRWGGTDQIDVMRYEDAVLDLMRWVDENYRTRAPGQAAPPN